MGTFPNLRQVQMNMILALATAALQSFHATIDNVLRIETDWWIVWPTIGAAVTSALVAFFTWRLASQTSALSMETKRVADETAMLARETLASVNIARTGSEIADKHHQESQSPVLIFVGGPHVKYNPAASSEDAVVINVLGGLWNVGFGAALRVVIEVEIDGGHVAQFTVGTVNVSQTTPYGDNFQLTFPKGSWPSRAIVPNAVVVLHYQNIYGGKRTTRYTLRPSATPDRSEIVTEEISEQGYVTRLS
jgi:hypothetical protein